VGSVIVNDRWAPAVRVTLSCHCCHTKTKTARRDERENNETNRLDKLGNTSRHSHRRVNDVVGGPRTRRGWGGNASSIHTNACFDTCASRQQSAAGWRGRPTNRLDRQTAD